MSEKKHLHPLAEAEIQGLKTAGIEPTLDECIWINDLARKVDNPDGGSTTAAGEPVQAGNVWLWPFTIQARIWYVRVCSWFDDVQDSNAVLAYALAHSRIDGAFEKLNTYAAIKQTCLPWYGSLACTDDELIQAIDAVISTGVEDLREHEKSESGSESQRGWMDIVAFLVHQTGIPPEAWTTRVTCDYVMQQVRTVTAQSNANGEAPDPDDPCIVAQRNLGIAIYKIKQSRKESDDG